MICLLRLGGFRIPYIQSPEKLFNNSFITCSFIEHHCTLIKSRLNFLVSLPAIIVTYVQFIIIALSNTLVFSNSIFLRKKPKSWEQCEGTLMIIQRYDFIFFFIQRYPAWKWISVTPTRPASTRNRWQNACAIQDMRATEQHAVLSVLFTIHTYLNFSFTHFAPLRTSHDALWNVNAISLFRSAISPLRIHIASFAFRIIM